jgi:hypothetical protein
MPLSQLDKAEFEVCLEDNARSSAIKTRRRLSKEARGLRTQASKLGGYDAQELIQEAGRLERESLGYLQQLDKAIAAKDYALGGDAVDKWLGTLEGLSKMAFLMLRIKQPNLTEKEVLALIREHDDEMIPAMRDANALGKQKAPTVQA